MIYPLFAKRNIANIIYPKFHYILDFQNLYIQLYNMLVS